MHTSNPSHQHHRYKTFIGTILIGLIPLIFLLWKFTKPTHKAQDKLLVVTTTGIIADALEEIGKDKIIVKALMNPGVDPHTYELTVQDGDWLMEADIIFYNGLHLEGPMHPIFQKMTQRKDKKIYAASNGLTPEDILSDPSFSAGQDPHIWHSVLLWKKAVQYMSEQLQREDPTNATFYQANTQAYLAKLDELHTYILAEIEKIPPHARILVTAHDAFEYFGRTYGISVKSLQGISTIAEPSLRDREALKNFIITHQIKTIFEETSVPSKGIQAVLESCRQEGYPIAANAHLYSDSLGEKGGDAGTYISMMRTNVNHIVKASQPTP